MLKLLVFLGTGFVAASSVASGQASVRIEPATLQGPRTLQDQTAKAAIRDYLHSWQTLMEAMVQNRGDLLNLHFVGVAKDKLADTVQQQATQGIRTICQDRVHDLKFVF